MTDVRCEVALLGFVTMETVVEWVVAIYGVEDGFVAEHSVVHVDRGSSHFVVAGGGKGVSHHFRRLAMKPIKTYLIIFNSDSVLVS